MRKRERARERERETARERERDRIQKSGKKITPTIFPFVDAGPISLGFPRESPARDMWCFVAYIYNGREREERGERDRERERDRGERRREYLAGSYYLQWDENCITYVFTWQFSRVLTPGHSSLGFSRESPAGDMWYYVPLMGNQRVGIIPPKWGILFVLSLALIWCRNFQDRTISVGGDTWPSFWPKELITRYTSARQYREAVRKKSTGTKLPDRHVTVRWISNRIRSTIPTK